jgi:polar amino acid transport system substrate-binding protein
MPLSRRHVPALTVLAAAVLVTAACSSAEPQAAETNSVNGQTYDLTPAQASRIHATKVDAIAAELPQAIRDRGVLRVTGQVGAVPPLGFYATDNTTIIGSEPDFGELVADVLGLKADHRNADWAQNFVAIDSGAVDAFISNVTVTEERKEKYDFATYRLDNLGLEIPKDATWTYADRKSLAGKRIGVSSGTNQEKILVDWDKQNQSEGLPKIDIAYYQNVSDYFLALTSGRLDGYLGPNPSVQYHASSTGKTKVVATFSGAGTSLQGKIAVLVKKDNGLIKPVHDAVQYLIDQGIYKKWLAHWGLESEAVPASEINPPGLPKQAP